MTGEQRAKAERFRALHRSPPIVVLPNVWDAVSAKLVERAGAQAIATASAAVGWSRGYADGEHISRDEMIDVVAAVTRAVDLPVSADLEAGYGDTSATAEAAVAAGAVGLNVEDEAGDPDEHVRRIRAIRDVSSEIVINARTDVLLRGDDLDEAVARSNAYLDAGADCAFVIGAMTGDAIAELVERIGGPVAVLATNGSPPIVELERLGVARVSVGPGLARAALTAADRAARELLESGTYGFLDGTFPSPELNRLLG
jgi:2-methylisocitrate lyase-like PEP mutase family enzyme